MAFDPQRHHRHSMRLRGYDYRLPGMYFVTVCSYRRECIFGSIEDGLMCPNPTGQLVIEEGTTTAAMRSEIRLDEWILMPNHVHAILVITEHSDGNDPFEWINTAQAPLSPARQPRSLGAIVGGFKSATTRRINALRGSPGVPVWQRGYYDHVIRTEYALERIRRYIRENPVRWALDPDNPTNVSSNDVSEPVAHRTTRATRPSRDQG